MNVNTLFYLGLFLISTTIVKGQTEEPGNGFEMINPSPASVVQQYHDNLKLTLVVDSIIAGRKKIIPNFKSTIQLSYESDYIQIKDSFYIKIFIARTQEYGNKFYMWKWDFLKKRADKYLSQGKSQYEIMDFGVNINPNYSNGHGVGVQGTPQYMMYYYRYKLE